MTEYIPLKVLAAELGLDRSNMRKYILKHGFTPVSVRTPDSRNQSTLALQIDDAEAVRQLRTTQGFGAGLTPLEGGSGYFYVIQLVPDLAPGRIKLGFASDVVTRLGAHQTAAPTAALVKMWPCKRSWEGAAIDSITRSGCVRIGAEVYQCDSVDEVVWQGNQFFDIMPGEVRTDA